MGRVSVIISILILAGLCVFYKLQSKLPHTVTPSSPVNSATAPSKLVRVNAGIALKHIMDSLKIPPSALHILVIKSKYELSVWHGKNLLKNYPVALGINPKDDKLKQGDRCTPEGFFNIQAKYPSNKWEKFMWLDYPNAESWRKYKMAVKAGKIKAGTDIGGEVGIHGVPAKYNSSIGPGHNWTWGCVCLTYEDINELYNCVSKQTLIEIRKK